MKASIAVLVSTLLAAPLFVLAGEQQVSAECPLNVDSFQPPFNLTLDKDDADSTIFSPSFANNNTSLQYQVVEWVRTNGGFFHDAQEVRQNKDGSYRGVYASREIQKGEILANIPWKCVITTHADSYQEDLFCDTTNLLIDEEKKGTDSLYAPYTTYLQQACPPILVPSTYSQEGRKVFETIVGDKQLPPQRATQWIDKYWTRECEGSDDHVKEAMALISRGDDGAFYPLIDMYNHRNGDWLNTKSFVKEGQYYIIKALTKIQAGDEIYVSYNQCKQCTNRKYTYGTPELFREYGFVEQYPQRWIFHKEEIAFDVDESEKGELQVTFLDDDVGQKYDDLYEVTEWGMDILEAHLDRLHGLNKTLLQPLLTKRTLPQQELDSIMSYYNALTQAIELAVEAAKHYEYMVMNDAKPKKKKKKSKKKETKKKDFYADHVKQHVSPGELALLKWKDTNEVIDPYAAQIGLPPTLVPTIKAFVDKLKILEIIKDNLYNNPCEPRRGRFYHLQNPFAQGPSLDFPPRRTNDTEMQWYTQRPGSEWHSDMHWFAPSNELTHEITIQMLMEGGFGDVLEVIGRQYDLDALTIQSAGFLAVTHCEEGYLHHDFKYVQGKVFNFLIPLYSPPNADEELRVVGERVKPNATNPKTAKEVQVETKIKYDQRYGVLVGDGTWHGTRDCDHRPNKEIRAVMSVYLADLTEDNLERVAYDDTAIFPIPGMDEWLWAQRGRHWMKDACASGDWGRRGFQAIDTSKECAELVAEGKCVSKPKSTRLKCPKSCGVFMSDWEYQPGVERSEIIGKVGLAPS